MSRRSFSFLRRFSKGNEGVALVELAVVLNVFLLLVLGTVEFGYLYYMKHVITNASREGARYGVVWRARADGSRMPPKELNPSIVTVTNNYLTKVLPTGTYNVTVTNNTGYTTGGKGQDLIVTVTGHKNWSALGGFIPKVKNLTITAQTDMKCE